MVPRVCLYPYCVVVFSRKEVCARAPAVESCYSFSCGKWVARSYIFRQRKKWDNAIFLGETADAVRAWLNTKFLTVARGCIFFYCFTWLLKIFDVLGLKDIYGCGEPFYGCFMVLIMFGRVFRDIIFSKETMYFLSGGKLRLRRNFLRTGVLTFKRVVREVFKILC